MAAASWSLIRPLPSTRSLLRWQQPALPKPLPPITTTIPKHPYFRMYVCTYVRARACTYIHTHIRTYVRTYIHTRSLTHIRTRARTHAHKHTHTHYYAECGGGTQHSRTCLTQHDSIGCVRTTTTTTTTNTNTYISTCPTQQDSIECARTTTNTSIECARMCASVGPACFHTEATTAS